MNDSLVDDYINSNEIINNNETIQSPVVTNPINKK